MKLFLSRSLKAFYLFVFFALNVQANLYVNDHLTRGTLLPNSAPYLVRLGNSDLLSPAGTGILMAPDIVLTSYHLIREHRQGSWSQDARTKFVVEKILEASSERESDYALVQIYWTGGKAPTKLLPVSELETTAEKFRKLVDQQSYLFTLGHPVDKLGQITWSVGKLMQWSPQSHKMYFNLGVTKGNSGGPIFMSGETKLLGIVNGGPHDPSDPLFYDNSFNDPKAWNYGTPLYIIYNQSPTLKKLFPQGRNRLLPLKNNKNYCSFHTFLWSENCDSEELWEVWKDPYENHWMLPKGQIRFLSWSKATHSCPPKSLIPHLDELEMAIRAGLFDSQINPYFGKSAKYFIHKLFFVDRQNRPHLYHYPSGKISMLTDSSERAVLMCFKNPWIY